MITTNILIDTIEKVKEFSAVIAQVESDCELVEGNHILDAKSIMGIFSMDLKKPMELRIYTEETTLPAAIKPFLAPNTAQE